MTIREAILQSTNTIAYQIMRRIEPLYGLQYLAKMRFSSLAPDDIYSTSVGLGGLTYGASPFEMAKAYSTLSNLGEYIDNNCVIRIVKQDEGEIFTEDSARIRVYSEDAAYMIIDCCKELLKRGDVGPRKAPVNALCFVKMIDKSFCLRRSASPVPAGSAATRRSFSPRPVRTQPHHTQEENK